MKNLMTILAIGFTSNLAIADCPSVDEVIQHAKQGTATQVDVLAAVACNTSYCSIKIAYAEANLAYMTELFEVGQKTKADVADAAIQFASTKQSCTK